MFFFNDTATTEIYTLSLHDALPIYTSELQSSRRRHTRFPAVTEVQTCRSEEHTSELQSHLISYAVFCLRSEEHTSELQSHLNLVCRLLLAKKKVTLTDLPGLCHTLL